MSEVRKIKRADYLFNSGIRKELLDIVLTCGAISYDGFEVLEEYHKRRDYVERVRKLIEEGILEEIRVTNRKMYRLTNGGYDLMTYMSDMSFYNSIGSAYAAELSKDQRRKLREKLMSETTMIMHAAGACAIGEGRPLTIFDNRIPASGAYFFSAREIKAGVVFSPANVEDPFSSKAKQYNSVFFGLLTCDGGDYVVYNMGKDVMPWKDTIEGHAKYGAGEFLFKFKIGVGAIPGKMDSIFFYKNDNAIADMFLEKTSNGKRSMFNRVYEKTYYLPFNIFGKRMLEIMTVSGWKEKLKKMCLGKYDIRTERIDVDCDGVERDENGKITTYFFLYCIPDIKRLRKFMNTAEINGSIEEEGRREKKEYVVMCFRHQKDFVDSVKNRYVRVKSAELNEEKVRMIEEM